MNIKKKRKGPFLFGWLNLFSLPLFFLIFNFVCSCIDSLTKAAMEFYSKIGIDNEEKNDKDATSHVKQEKCLEKPEIVSNFTERKNDVKPFKSIRPHSAGVSVPYLSSSPYAQTIRPKSRKDKKTKPRDKPRPRSAVKPMPIKIEKKERPHSAVAQIHGTLLTNPSPLSPLLTADALSLLPQAQHKPRIPPEQILRGSGLQYLKPIKSASKKRSQSANSRILSFDKHTSVTNEESKETVSEITDPVDGRVEYVPPRERTQGGNSANLNGGQRYKTRISMSANAKPKYNPDDSKTRDNRVRPYSSQVYLQSAAAKKKEEERE